MYDICIIYMYYICYIIDIYYRYTYIYIYIYICTSCDQVHELSSSYCGDKREGALLSWLHDYTCLFIIYIYIYKYI